MSYHKPKVWSRKGTCPGCAISTGSRHKPDCNYIYTATKGRYTKKPVELTDAAHPARQTAIHIIEEVIEPLMGKSGRTEGINGEDYYNTEDVIVEIIKTYLLNH